MIFHKSISIQVTSDDLDTVQEAMLNSGTGEVNVLTAREENILNLIVSDYIRDATPVASEAIAKRHDLGVSSATIRNDVVELEQEGFITRPHSSAGSVPLDKGYRLHVESVGGMRADRIPPRMRAAIRKRLLEVERDIDEWSSAAAAILAQLVDNVAIATFPKARESRVKHVELVSLQDLFVLLIVVFGQARLKRQLIRLNEPMPQTDLQAVTNRINEALGGLTWREIESKEMKLSSVEEEFVSATAVMLRDEDRFEYHDHYLDGLSNLLVQPEFVDKNNVRSFVEGVEDGSLAQAVLDEVPDTGVVRVVIGQENREDMLKPFSVVIGQYGIPDKATGAVGAIGPVRMEYTKAIAAVELMVEVMNDFVVSIHSG